MQNIHVSGLVQGGDVGGLIGDVKGVSISNSYAEADVVGIGIAGGLVGILGDGHPGYITDSYALGNVSGNYAGGLAGFVIGGGIESSYAGGTVTGQLPVGGLVGNGNPALVQNSYWDTTSSGVNTSSGGTGLTTAQLKSGLPAGFDPAVWGIDAAINDGYPYLLWQVPTAVVPTTLGPGTFVGPVQPVNQTVLNPETALTRPHTHKRYANQLKGDSNSAKEFEHGTWTL